MKKYLLSLLIVMCVAGRSMAQDNLGAIKMGDMGNSPKMSSEEIQGFKDLIIRKVNLLSLQIKTIADKSMAQERRKGAIAQAVKLFDSPDNYVEVSKKGSPEPKKYKVPLYFRKLYAIPAAKVEITFYEVAKVSDLVQGEDGRYHGTAYIYQLYVSRDGEGNLIYSDKTIKKVGVSVAKVKQRVGDKDLEMWDVKLGNIKVSETTEGVAK